MRRPWLILLWLLVFALEIAAVVAVQRMPFTDDFAGALQSENPAFTRYAAQLEEYGAADGDIVVLFEAADFADGTAHLVTAEFLTEMQFMDHVTAVISPFSFRVTQPDGTQALLFRDDLAPGDHAAWLRAALEDTPGLSSVLSPSLDTMRAVILTSDLPVDTRDRARVMAAFEDLAARAGAGTGVTISLTGHPVIDAAVSQRLDDDTALLNTLGVVMGLGVAWIALRKLVLAMAIALTAHTARLWSLAVLVPFGYEITAVTITLPTLIVVLAFSEAIHLAMALRRTCHDGQPRPLWRALVEIWPAALLAALTTSGAFAAMFLSPSAIVRDLALYGMLAVLIATPVTLGLMLLMAATLDRWIGLQRALGPPVVGAAQTRAFNALAGGVKGRARAVSLFGVVLVVLSAIGYAALEPDSSFYDGLRESDLEIQTLRRIEAEFGPITRIDFEHPLEPPAAYASAVAALSALSPWGPALALSAEDLEALPPVLRDRVVSQDGTRTLISLPYPYAGSAQARADIAALEAALAEDTALGALGPPSGAVHVYAFVTQEVQYAFSLCFLLAAVATGLGIGLWLRSPALGLLSVLPNVLPITVMGSLMWLLDISFNYTSGIALTIAFGIAVDDTVHMINRIRQEARDRGAWSEEAVLAALHRIGPTLVLTSVILIGGISGTLFSSLPILVSFGVLSMSVFVLALVADLVLLPALLLWYDAARRGRGQRAAPRGAQTGGRQ